jgi:predicted secreted acid phosphatase
MVNNNEDEVMKNVWPLLSVSALLICMGFSSAYGTSIETKDISEQQLQQIKQYYHSGSYFKEIEQKLADAIPYLELQLQHPRANRLAIVFDIDETALSNFKDMERLSFTRNVIALTGAVMQANAEVIPSVLALYQYALAKKIAVFFISSRPNTPEFVDITVKNLKRVGYDNWTEIYLKPINREELSVQEFKTTTRRNISLLGYDIVLNVGDQEADLEGGFAEANVKIPNPFYGVS